MNYPRNPYKDGIRFQIRTLMRSKRVIYWADHIGGGQHLLRIRKSNFRNNRQWFVFDWRTHTIRAWADRRKVISNQLGQKFLTGRRAVVRVFKGENYQRIQYHGGSRRNIRNNGEKCLDVYGGRDNEN